jgi:hypothetical protein
MGMTWRMKVQRVAFALGIVAILALAAGANWIDAFCGSSW